MPSPETIQELDQTTDYPEKELLRSIDGTELVEFSLEFCNCPGSPLLFRKEYIQIF